MRTPGTVTVTVELPPVAVVPMGDCCYRATSIDAAHVRGVTPKINVGGNNMTLVEVEHVALTMLHMVRTHPDSDGRLLSETKKRARRAAPT